MDGKHEGLSDEALEREIEAALGVDPSPEFLPRVRERIASERMQEGWLVAASWRWASVVAVVIAAATVGAWILRDPAPAPAAREVRVAPSEAARPPIEPAPPASVRLPVLRAVHTTPRTEVAAPFEVLISADESAALKQLFTAIENRRIETSALPDLQSALKPPAPIEEIALDPITISPLAALEGE